jgi:preprotein translocase subunit SecF
MLSKKHYLFFLIICLVTLISFSGFSQEEDSHKNLEGQFEYLMKKSTTYQDYKVIKVVGINQFWDNVNDTIRVIHSNYYGAQKEITGLKVELASTKDTLDVTSTALEESNYGRDRISFLGIPLLKGAYNSLVWGIILLLIVIVVVLFIRFMKSNSITKNTNKEYNKLEEDFEAYKKNSRENEINLKRELQTAHNTIEDLRH